MRYLGFVFALVFGVMGLLGGGFPCYLMAGVYLICGLFSR